GVDGEGFDGSVEDARQAEPVVPVLVARVGRGGEAGLAAGAGHEPVAGGVEGAAGAGQEAAVGAEDVLERVSGRARRLGPAGPGEPETRADDQEEETWRSVRHVDNRMRTDAARRLQNGAPLRTPPLSSFTRKGAAERVSGS